MLYQPSISRSRRELPPVLSSSLSWMPRHVRDPKRTPSGSISSLPRPCSAGKPRREPTAARCSRLLPCLTGLFNALRVRSTSPFGPLACEVHGSHSGDGWTRASALPFMPVPFSSPSRSTITFCFPSAPCRACFYFVMSLTETTAHERGEPARPAIKQQQALQRRPHQETTARSPASPIASKLVLK